MFKLLQISGFYKGKDKFGNEVYQIDGLAYEKNNNYVGVPSKRVWVRSNIIKELNENDLRKDLYVMYNEKGRIIKVDVK